MCIRDSHASPIRRLALRSSTLQLRSSALAACSTATFHRSRSITTTHTRAAPTTAPSRQL
eukprot:6182365-Pleurochrysis_carterae.AAC.1